MQNDAARPGGSELSDGLGPLPEGDRFKDVLKFRRLGTGCDDALYECWGEAVRAYAAAEVARAVAAEHERWVHVFDGWRVLQALTPEQRKRIGYADVSDVLDAVARLSRA